MKKYQVQDFAESVNLSITELFEEAYAHQYGRRLVNLNRLQVEVNNFYVNEEVPAYVQMYILYRRRAS